MDAAELGGGRGERDRSERLLDLVLETGAVVAAGLDTDLRHEWVHNPNPDPPEAEILGKRDDELYPPSDADPTMALKRVALEEDRRVDREFVFQKPWGPVAYRAAAEPTHDEAGEQTGVLFAAFDRTEQYQLLDRTTDGVYTVDPDWRVTFWNDTMAERTGVEAETVVGERLWDQFGDTIPATLAEAYRGAMATGEPVELEQYVPEPFDYWVEVRAFPGDGGMTVFSRDVTETVERTRELERREYLFDEMQEIAELGVWEYDPISETLWWSDGMYRVHGLESTDDPPTIEGAIECYHPDDRPRVEAAFERALEDGTGYSLDLRLANPDGGVRDVRNRAEAVTEHGEVVLVRGTIQDITAVKRTERSLRQQNERLDDFVDLVAHDLRNPLSVATAFTDIAIEDDSVDDLDRVQAALGRMEDLLEDVLTAAHAGQSLTETAPIDVAGLARSAWENVDTSDAELHVEEGIGQVQGEYGRLLRLFENLVRNAVEHGATSPDASASRDAVEHGGGGVTVTVGPLADAVGFYVADDGVGIPPSERDRVFERGYSTNREGTGFGLAIVADVVAVHGWTVEVAESADGGARFEITVTNGPS
ncbi:PAS domain-containing protein [Salinirubellus salinus]|uniref:histidine kinase n=1 Tax=Salinirubellus salinus TaxID=1364945 RepID=A0A9E7R069_9EURY|nr:PAS domain-containing protein [Salinirubellus salinus]UWM53217.1 PAS domain-containing protein [Salinirubellus salinus]